MMLAIGSKSQDGKHGPGARVLASLLALACLQTPLTVAAADPKPKPAVAATDAKPKPAATPAAKPAQKQAASAAFSKGKEAFDAKKWQDALASFQRAEDLIPAATAEYYIARCNEELGNWAEAASWYGKAIDKQLKPDLASDAQNRLDALKKRPVKVKVDSAPAGASIAVDGALQSEKTPTEIELAPGPHKLTLSAPGMKDAQQDVEVAAFTGATVSVSLETAPPPPPPPAPPPPVVQAPPPAPLPPPAPPPPRKDWTWVYVTGGAAVVGLGVGTVFGIMALSNKSTFDEQAPLGTADSVRKANDARDDGTRNALISDMGFGIGVTLAVTTLVLAIASPAAEEKSASNKGSKMSFSPFVAPMGGATMAGGSALFHF